MVVELSNLKYRLTFDTIVLEMFRCFLMFLLNEAIKAVAAQRGQT